MNIIIMQSKFAEKIGTLIPLLKLDPFSLPFCSIDSQIMKTEAGGAKESSYKLD